MHHPFAWHCPDGVKRGRNDPHDRDRNQLQCSFSFSISPILPHRKTMPIYKLDLLFAQVHKHRAHYLYSSHLQMTSRFMWMSSKSWDIPFHAGLSKRFYFTDPVEWSGTGFVIPAVFCTVALYIDTIFTSSTVRLSRTPVTDKKKREKNQKTSDEVMMSSGKKWLNLLDSAVPSTHFHVPSVAVSVRPIHMYFLNRFAKTLFEKKHKL